MESYDSNHIHEKRIHILNTNAINDLLTNYVHIKMTGCEHHALGRLKITSLAATRRAATINIFDRSRLVAWAIDNAIRHCHIKKRLEVNDTVNKCAIPIALQTTGATTIQTSQYTRMSNEGIQTNRNTMTLLSHAPPNNDTDGLLIGRNDEDGACDGTLKNACCDVWC